MLGRLPRYQHGGTTGSLKDYRSTEESLGFTDPRNRQNKGIKLGHFSEKPKERIPVTSKTLYLLVGIQISWDFINTRVVITNPLHPVRDI